MRPAPPLSAWKSHLVADLERVALQSRWGLALMAIGWIHLAVFLVCQALYPLKELPHVYFVALWALELVANLLALRLVVGRGWIRSTPLIGVLARVWATFLILSFNVASLNTLTGWGFDWFKPVWSTLSTFGFATTAYLVNVWFFVPAVQMYFTGLLMVANPRWQYAIYGISWWLALHVIGLTIESWRARRLRLERGVRETSVVESALAAFVPGISHLEATNR